MKKKQEHSSSSSSSSSSSDDKEDKKLKKKDHRAKKEKKLMKKLAAAIGASAAFVGCVIVICCWFDASRRHRAARAKQTSLVWTPPKVTLAAAYAPTSRRMDPYRPGSRAGNNTQKTFAKVTASDDDQANDRLAREFGMLVGDDPGEPRTPRSARSNRSNRSNKISHAEPAGHPPGRPGPFGEDPRHVSAASETPQLQTVVPSPPKVTSAGDGGRSSKRTSSVSAAAALALAQAGQSCDRAELSGKPAKAVRPSVKTIRVIAGEDGAGALDRGPVATPMAAAFPLGPPEVSGQHPSIEPLGRLLCRVRGE